MAYSLAPALRFRRLPPGTLRRVLGPEWLLGWLLVSPVVLIVTSLLIYPFLDSIALSFQSRFIGNIFSKRWCESSHNIRGYLDQEGHDKQSFSTHAPRERVVVDYHVKNGLREIRI